MTQHSVCTFIQVFIALACGNLGVSNMFSYLSAMLILFNLYKTHQNDYIDFFIVASKCIYIGFKLKLPKYNMFH